MLFKAYRSDRENGFMGAADDIGTDTGTSDRPVAGASLCRQRREVSCYEICGNGAGAWTGNRGSSPACIWKQCIDQKQYGSSSGHYPCSDHTGACGEAGSSYGHVSGGGGSFTAGM